MTQTLVIAVFNHKGGVGKTCTAVNLAASLVFRGGSKVLVVDMDPQANASRALLGEDFAKERVTIKNVLLSESSPPVRLSQTLLPSSYPSLLASPSDLNLSEAEFKLFSTMRREFILRKALDDVRGRFDYVLVDCPPSLGLLTLNALTAADYVIIPVETQYLSLTGLHSVLELILLVKERLNPKLRILGVLPTKYYILSKANQEALACLHGLRERVHVFDTVIPRDVKAEEAPSHGKVLLEYAPEAKVTEQYLKLADEVIHRCRN
ncbi:MAG: chromosome partitioning protein ParA [Candidatus Hydrogenedentota bacterium]